VPETAAAPGVLDRQVLLLTALAGRAPDLAGAVRGRSGAEADVLITEDEPILAMDLGPLVTACGDPVTGIAATQTEAVALTRSLNPTVILADSNLGMGGDGKSAVAEIRHEMTAPAIFGTAYPERLLTGEAVEPAFVITKPFDPIMLAIATYQAVTGELRLG
jgi:CheY-like chemotaxis protein